MLLVLLAHSSMPEKSPFSHPSSSLLPQNMLPEMLCYIVCKHCMHINMILRYFVFQICLLLLSASKEGHQKVPRKLTTKSTSPAYPPGNSSLLPATYVHLSFVTSASWPTIVILPTSLKFSSPLHPMFFSRLLLLPHSIWSFNTLWYLGGRKSMIGDGRGQGCARAGSEGGSDPEGHSTVQKSVSPVMLAAWFGAGSHQFWCMRKQQGIVSTMCVLFNYDSFLWVGSLGGDKRGGGELGHIQNDSQHWNLCSK